VSTGAHTQLGVNWARFSPGYRVTNSTEHVEKGSAHIISFKNPTEFANLPTVGTGTYNVIRGGTKPTILFENNGVVQQEVIGNLDAATITVDFATGTTSASFAGSFADGGNGGQFELNGGLTNALNNSTFAAFGLNGTVVSGQISSANGSNCSGTCAIHGHTDLRAIGMNAQGIGGVFHANTAQASDNSNSLYSISSNQISSPGFVSSSSSSSPVFGVVGTYLLEKPGVSVNSAVQSQMTAQ